MEVTTDKYALPVAVAETADKLAKMRGLERSSIHAYMRKAQKRGWKYPKYIIVEMDEETGEENGSKEM